jgi:hypothetical protein
MTHDQLAEDLAIAKGGIPFLNACLGSVFKKSKTARADLVVCTPSYTRFCLSVYEVKVTRADFLSDIRSCKWRDYLPHCHRFYFAVAKGVADKSDIPDEAGLVVRGPKGWHTAVAAPKRTLDIPRETMLALVFAKQRRSAREKRLDDVIDMSRGHEYMRHDFGGRIKAARVLGNQMGKLHEAAMRAGGLEKATKILEAAMGVR